MCYAGECVPQGTTVPLVVVGVVGGQRRPYFRHPPGTAPGRRHRPESVWHVTAKAALAAWARELPDVEEVTVEWVTPDRHRRSDVRVRLRDGTTIALEAQSSVLTDTTWQQRHEDYQQLGIHDVWLWKPGMARVPWITAEHGQHLWEFDPREGVVTFLVGEGRPKPPGWWLREDDRLRVYGLHAPPTVHARLRRYPVPLYELRLTADGIAVPDVLTTALAEDHARQCTLAAVERAKARKPPTRSPAKPRGQRPTTVAQSPSVDEDPVTAAIRKHYGDPDGIRILAERGIHLP